MLSAVHDLTEALAGEYHGQCIQMNDEASIIGFKEAKQAVMYALRLRKTILDSTWPERILVLPSCEPQPMAVKLQPKAKGPQLQTVIDLVCAIFNGLFARCLLRPRDVSLLMNSPHTTTNMPVAPAICPLRQPLKRKKISAGCSLWLQLPHARF